MLRYFFLLIPVLIILLAPSEGLADRIISQPNPTTYYEELRTNLLENRKEIKEAQDKWLASFDEKSRFYHDKIRQLSQIRNRLRKNWEYDGLLKDYAYVVEIWRMFADDSFDSISGANIDRLFPDVVQLDSSVHEQVTAEQYQSLKELNDQVNALFNQAISAFDERQEKNSLGYSKVLLAAGKLRSQQYQRLQALGYPSVSTFTTENIQDFVRELRIIPVRWTATFYSKLLEFRDYSRAGIEGYIYIIKELLIFIILISFCVFFAWTFQKFVSVFEGYAEKLHKRLTSSTTHWIWMYGVTVLNKSIPWVLLLLGVWFAIGLVETSSFRELSNIFPYIDFYIYYRLYLTIADDFFTRLKSGGIISLNPHQNDKTYLLNRSVGRFLFASIALLHTIDTVVGKAMVYSTTLNLVYVLGGLYILHWTSWWNEEILNSKKWVEVKKRISSNFHDKIKKTRFFSSFIILLILISLHFFDWCSTYLGQFDSFKKLSALMLRARLNKVQDLQKNDFEKKLPQSYINQFNPNKLAKECVTNRKEFKEALSYLTNWVSQNEAQHSMLVYGSNGSGKSIFLSELCQHVKGVESQFIDIKEKQISSSQIIKQLRNTLGGKTDDLESLIQHWRSHIKKPTVVFLDNAHHLFLSHLGGLEGMKTLMRIINADIETIFWCVSFHRESWYYIRRALKDNLCFDRTIELAPWSAEELQKYIMKCHIQSGYKASFDDILTLLGEKRRRENRSTIESQFFKLLWEQTDGNPARASSLWLNSLSFDGQETMKITKPPLEDISNFLSLDDDIHFLCASLIRHESLSDEQIGSVNNLTKDVTARLVKYALEKKLIIEHEPSIYRLNPNIAGYITRSLRRKNYVYG